MRASFPVAAGTAALAILLAPRGARAEGCPAGNLLERARLVRWVDTEHPTALLTDGAVVPEGAPWAGAGVVFTSNAGSLTYDLGAPVPIRALYLQADAASAYSLWVSRDNKAWRSVRIAEAGEGAGLRSRFAPLGPGEGVEARFVRFGEPKGGGAHVASELALYCEPPARAGEGLRVLARDPDPEPGMDLSPGSRLWLELTGAPWLTDLQVGAVKLALALSALALLLFGALARRAPKGPPPASIGGGLRPPPTEGLPWERRAAFGAVVIAGAPPALVGLALLWPHDSGSALAAAALVGGVAACAMLALALGAVRAGGFYRAGEAGPTPTTLPRLRAAVLAAVALASFAGYFNFGAYRYPDYIHHHEFFHHFLGAKYFRELEYTRLYACAAAAEAEQGLRRRVELRPIRDLSTNTIVDGAAALRDAQEACKTRFSAPRWAAFKKDVAYFRDPLPPEQQRRLLRDHGYNASPLGTLEGSLAIGDREASRGLIGYGDTMWAGVLGLLDPALIMAAMAAVAWAFGWRAAAVAAVYFGTNPLATYAWTGGAFLRQDWLAATLIGLSLLKKERPAAGGASLAYAALLRVFPAAFLVPLMLRGAWEGWKERRIPRLAARVCAGALIAVAVLVPVSSVAAGGAGAWPAFVSNTRKQATTAMANLVGLPSALAFRPSTRAEVLADASQEDPLAAAREARKNNFREALVPYAILAVASLYGLGRASARASPSWRVAALGAAVIPLFLELASYYFSFLIVAALEDDDVVPIGLLALTVVLRIVFAAFSGGDVAHAAASVAVVAFAALYLHRRATRAPEGSVA